MAKPQKREPCPRCGAEAEIYASQGGARGECTTYGARCKCGLDEYGFSNDGTRRSAISTWNRWAREEKAKRGASGVTAAHAALACEHGTLYGRTCEACDFNAGNVGVALPDPVGPILTGAQEDAVRRGYCPKCKTRTLGAPNEGAGVQFRGCSRCKSVYAVGVNGPLEGRDG